MINWIAGQPLGRHFRALVAQSGFLHLTSLSSGDSNEAPYEDAFGGPPWEVRREYERYDPSRFVRNWKTPMLFIAGTLDSRCPVSESLAAFTVCQRLGVKSEVLVFEDEGREVRQAENLLVWYQTVLMFLKRFTDVEIVRGNGGHGGGHGRGDREWAQGDGLL